MSPTGDRPISCSYLIASHTQPAGVARLARTLLRESPASHVWIHHDAKAGRFPSELLAGLADANLVREPVAAHWGTFSLVELALRSLREIRASGNEYDWVALLSGQHYPVRPLRHFESMLKNSGADAIVSFRTVTPSDRHLRDRYGFRYRRILAGPLPRVLRAKQLYDTVFNSVQPFVRVQTDQRGTFVGWRNRNSVFDLGVPVYKGSQWWAMSRAAVETVLDAVDKGDIVERFAGTLIPDESFFQTLLLNSGLRKAKNADLHYEHFQRGDSSPRFLNIRDLEAIRASQRWFARKIDADDDGGLREAIDALRVRSALETAT